MITVDDVLDLIREKADEDMHKLGGVLGEGDLYLAAFKTARSRFGWLAINLITAILASISIALFSTAIEKLVSLAILMPIVASMGGNAGTQTLTVAVRAMATRELTSSNSLRVFGKEILVGTYNGLFFAFIIGKGQFNPLVSSSLSNSDILFPLSYNGFQAQVNVQDPAALIG